METVDTLVDESAFLETLSDEELLECSEWLYGNYLTEQEDVARTRGEPEIRDPRAGMRIAQGFALLHPDDYPPTVRAELGIQPSDYS